MSFELLAVIITVVVAFIPVIGALIKLYGDIRVLKSSQDNHTNYIQESEAARHVVVEGVTEMKKDIEYIKMDIEASKAFRKTVYEHLLNDSALKKQA